MQIHWRAGCIPLLHHWWLQRLSLPLGSLADTPQCMPPGAGFQRGWRLALLVHTPRGGHTMQGGNPRKFTRLPEIASSRVRARENHPDIGEAGLNHTTPPSLSSARFGPEHVGCHNEPSSGLPESVPFAEISVRTVIMTAHLAKWV